MATLHTTILEVDLTIDFAEANNDIIRISVDYPEANIYELFERSKEVMEQIESKIDAANPIGPDEMSWHEFRRMKI